MKFRFFNKLGITLATVAFLSTAVFSASAYFDSVGSLIGDINADSEINVNDATYLQKILANKETAPENYEYIADTYLDGIINIKDATVIQMYSAKMIDTIPYTSPKQEETQPTESTVATDPVVTQPTTQPPTDENGWNNGIFKP